MSQFAIMVQYLHIVLLKVKAGTSDDEVSYVFQSLKALLSDNLIPGLLEYNGGPYSSPEGLNKGFTHAFTMKFSDEKSRDDYFPHPEHEKVKNVILPLVDDVLCFDYAL